MPNTVPTPRPSTPTPPSPSPISLCSRLRSSFGLDVPWDAIGETWGAPRGGVGSGKSTSRSGTVTRVLLHRRIPLRFATRVLARCGGFDSMGAGVGRNARTPLRRSDDRAVATHLQARRSARSRHVDDQTGHSRSERRRAVAADASALRLSSGSGLRRKLQKSTPRRRRVSPPAPDSPRG